MNPGSGAPIQIALLGAATLLGQTAICMLDGHPFLKLAEVLDIDSATGTFGAGLQWLKQNPLPQSVSALPHKRIGQDIEAKYCLSLLPDGASVEWDRFYARRGSLVVAHAEECRFAEDFTLVLPELNLSRSWMNVNRLFATPNCTTVLSALPLSALHLKIGLTSVRITCLQAVSGADLPGLPYLAIAENMLPDLETEEQALERELRFLFDESFPVEARCVRVPVGQGHLLLVEADLAHHADTQEITSALAAHCFADCIRGLPSAAKTSIRIVQGKHRPRPALDIAVERGMSVSVGGIALRRPKCLRFTIAGDNLVRGAAGTTLLALEALVQMTSGQLFRG